MRSIRNWVTTWRTTLKIKWNNPELYAFLCSDERRDLGNYTEVTRPDTPS